uniref:Uncharacterized protein n=1 Tax=viral metagenome TaxID=1070528 RepID=A0A6M3LY45_9ZZZZ
MPALEPGEILGSHAVSGPLVEIPRLPIAGLIVVPSSSPTFGAEAASHVWPWSIDFVELVYEVRVKFYLPLFWYVV